MKRNWRWRARDCICKWRKLLWCIQRIKNNKIRQGAKGKVPIIRSWLQQFSFLKGHASSHCRWSLEQKRKKGIKKKRVVGGHGEGRDTHTHTHTWKLQNFIIIWHTFKFSSATPHPPGDKYSGWEHPEAHPIRSTPWLGEPELKSTPWRKQHLPFFCKLQFWLCNSS